MTFYSKALCAFLLLSSSCIFSLEIFQFIEKNNKKGIREWLKKGSDLNIVNEQGQTPLMYAVITDKSMSNKNSFFIKQLIKKGALVNEVDIHGKTSLDYAVELNKASLILKLVKAKACVTTDENLYKVKSIIKKRIRRFKILANFFLGTALLLSVPTFAFGMSIVTIAPASLWYPILTGWIMLPTVYAPLKINAKRLYKDLQDIESIKTA